MLYDETRVTLNVHNSKKKGNIMEKKEFSIDNTLALKGIAIIMLIFYHCFSTVSRFKNYDVSFFPLEQDLAVEITLTFKICVSIFTFITGYGLMLSLKKLNAEYKWDKKEICKWILNRLIKLLSGFVIIVVLSWIICQAIDGKVWDTYFSDGGILYGIIQMVIEFLGLSDIMGTSTLNTTWWYMSAAVLFVLSVPLFAKLFKKIGTISTLLLVVFVPRIIGWEYSNSSYMTFLFCLLLGMFFAENNLMMKIANFKIVNNRILNKIIKFILETIFIILMYFVYSNLPAKLFWEIRYGIIPVCLMCYLYEFFIDIPIIKQTLKFLGKHSMNIFLIHTFIRATYMRDFIYSFGNWIIIAIVLLGISLVLSIVLELFKKLIRYGDLVKKSQEFVIKL